MPTNEQPIEFFAGCGREDGSADAFDAKDATTAINLAKAAWASGLYESVVAWAAYEDGGHEALWMPEGQWSRLASPTI